MGYSLAAWIAEVARRKGIIIGMTEVLDDGLITIEDAAEILGMMVEEFIEKKEEAQ